MKNNKLLTSLILSGIASTASAATLNMLDYTVTADGSGTRFQQATNINALNGGNVLSASGDVVYMITTFTFGTGTLADMGASFDVSSGHVAERIGFRVQDNGLVDTWGTANALIDFGEGPNSPARTTATIDGGGAAGFMSGKTVTLISRLFYDFTTDHGLRATDNGITELYNWRGTNQVIGTGSDTLMNVWINPTGASVEGSGPSAGDIYAVWDSKNFGGFDQSIWNNSTATGSSSITNTVVLTGTDATFANALSAAGVAIPEPSTALLGGLGFLALLRRRR